MEEYITHVSLAIPKELYLKAKVKAKEQDRNFTAYVRNLIKKDIK